MIGTNRDITAMCEAVEYELFRLQALNAVVRAGSRSIHIAEPGT